MPILAVLAVIFALSALVVAVLAFRTARRTWGLLRGHAEALGLLRGERDEPRPPDGRHP